MITIENALRILKNDHNFREIIDKVNNIITLLMSHLITSAMTAAMWTASTLFFVKGDNFKKNFWEKRLNQAYGSMSVRRF